MRTPEIMVDRPLASAEATLGDPDIEAAFEPAALEAGTHVGRYVVLGKLGAGGMGVVYAAHDPELDRRVAIKLLRPAGGRETTLGRARLVREAQAMARLTHPNVVTIHDVGEHAGAVYLAMEFVEGRTLRRWVEERGPSWPAVVDVFTQAARGLAAAHDADLVHRDFKPDNVMVGDDGRVLVMDFGLARSRGESSSSGDMIPISPDSKADPLATPLTQDGSVVGTPAYMAPEQHLSLPADARTDQFSFCVTMYEALYGERPFEGKTAAAIAFSVTQGTVRAAPKSTRVPGWVRRVCLRGLRPTPEDRFADMHALIAAIVRGRAHARRRRWTLGVAFVGIAAGGWSYGEHLSQAATVQACHDAAADLDAAWNTDTKRRMTEAFVASGVPGADAMAAKVNPWVDGWAKGWRDARRSTCLAADVEHTMDAATRERADACLDERRIHLEVFVDELTGADPRVVRSAVSRASSLPSADACASAHDLATWPMPPPQARDGVPTILRALSSAETLAAAGRYDEGLAAAETALAQAQALDFAPLQAQARGVVGGLHGRLGDYAQAETMLADAYVEAEAAGVPRVAADAATRLVHVVGVEREHHAEALVWARAAEAAIAPLEPEEPGLRTARLLGNVAAVQDARGEYRDALREHERGLRIRERILGPDHPEVASALASLATTHRALADFDRAQALQQRVLAIRESVYGAAHPVVATSISALALLDMDRGDYSRALGQFTAALELAERAYGPDHPDVANLLGSLAAAHRAMRDPKTAMPLYERALKIRRAALGPDHPDVGRALNNIATAHHMLGEYREEREALTEALAIWEAAVGPSHPEIAPLLVNLAKAHEVDEDYDTAQRMYERALKIRRAALGADHVKLAYVHVGLGNVAMERDRPADALVHAQRAVTLRDGGRAPDPELAEARFLLARATWAATPADGGDKTRALELAAEVVEQFRATEGMDGPRRFVEGWIADHSEPEAAARRARRPRSSAGTSQPAK